MNCTTIFIFTVFTINFAESPPPRKKRGIFGLSPFLPPTFPLLPPPPPPLPLPPPFYPPPFPPPVPPPYYPLPPYPPPYPPAYPPPYPFPPPSIPPPTIPPTPDTPTGLFGFLHTLFASKKLPYPVPQPVPVPVPSPYAVPVKVKIPVDRPVHYIKEIPVEKIKYIEIPGKPASITDHHYHDHNHYSSISFSSHPSEPHDFPPLTKHPHHNDDNHHHDHHHNHNQHHDDSSASFSHQNIMMSPFLPLPSPVSNVQFTETGNNDHYYHNSQSNKKYQY